MRCSCCKYAQSYVGEGSGYYEEDSCTLCSLTNENEQTENRYGIGCKFNYRTLDKRNKELNKMMNDSDVYLG